jgi:ribosome biogenesis GTPase
VISKIDLVDDAELKKILTALKSRIKDVPIVPLSNHNQKGYSELQNYIFKGQTYCLLGSSGVGKSTLVNNVAGQNVMQTDTISLSTGKGKHVTSHRELIVLENGGILVDNPGMREVGITEQSAGIVTTFDTIEKFAKRCRYTDCKHLHEEGCAVIQAVEEGEIDRDSYSNYLKMEKERKHFETSITEKRKKDKELGKVIRNYKKFKRDNE